MSKKDSVLKIIARSQCTPRTVLMLDKNNKVQRGALDYYLKKNCIKEKTGKERTKEGTFTEKFYSITKKGLLEIYEENGADWTGELDITKIETARNIDLDATSDSDRDRILKKIAKITETRIISEKIGAATSAVTKEYQSCGGSEKTGQITFAEIVEDAMIRWNKYQEAEKKETDLRFYSITEMKEELLKSHILKKVKENEDAENTINDFRRCLLDGILVSDNRLFAMYANIGISNNWYEWCVRQDIRIIKIWAAKNYNGKRSTDGLTGIMFVKNSIQYLRAYSDKNLKKKESPIGTGYDQFYILPIDADGVDLLRLITSVDIDEYEKMITPQIREIGFYENTKMSSDVFRYTNDSDEFMWIGIWMDVLKMKRISLIQKLKPNVRIIILCTEWQEKYYRVIFPEAELIQYIMPEQERNADI